MKQFLKLCSSLSLFFLPACASRRSNGVVLSAENGRALNQSLPCTVPLFTDSRGPIILHVVDRCRLVLREVPGLGRSAGRAAVVVCSVKLVHQRIESGEAGVCALGHCSRLPNCVDRVCHDFAAPWSGHGMACVRCQVLARVHDGSPCAVFSRGVRVMFTS